MRKVGVFLFIFVILISISVLAQEEVDEAYACLQDKVDSESSSSLSLQEAVFATLALGKQDKLENTINNEKGSNCWPKSGCTLKDTAQVLLAYDKMNKNTGDIESWLLSKQGASSSLSWFLQIDVTSHEASTCSITYNSQSFDININDDLTLSGNAGGCLSITPSKFWMQINNNCLDETFQVSCSDSFISSLLYQKSGSSTIFVSPTTHTGSSGGMTEESVNSKCFTTGSSCDYEGSLWAAIALSKTGKDVSAFTPYLLAGTQDNQRLFPSAFLYILTRGNDQFSEIIQSQNQNGYWQAPGTKYNRFYDTALGMLSLQSSSASELSGAKSYLLNTRTSDGCWNNNNIRDTGFILYSGWPRTIYVSEDPVCGNGVRESGEECDDGNTINNDGCDSSCDIENNGGGGGGGGGSNSVCGNWFLESGEECDDGNTRSGDGCDSSCDIEEPPRDPVCGNGILEAGEQCDDGNTINNDGCDSSCDIENSPPLEPVCGDWYLEGLEQCDDGNTINGDGCSDICELEDIIIDEPIASCETSGFYCENRNACTSSGGFILESYWCPGFVSCCDAPVLESSCAVSNGVICTTSQTCSGAIIYSSDGACCLDTCEEVITPTLTQCERLDGSCEFSCDPDTEEESFDSCDDVSLVCCVYKSTTTTTTKKSKTGVWITLLIILIILAALGIIFRKRLQLWVHKTKNKRKGQKGPPGLRPRGPPGPPLKPIGRRPMPLRRPPPGRGPPPRGPPGRPAPGQRPSPPQRPQPQKKPKPQSKTDKELDETLAKLKKMSE
jgi:cysteine-rich repeat protein